MEHFAFPLAVVVALQLGIFPLLLAGQRDGADGLALLLVTGTVVLLPCWAYRARLATNAAFHRHSPGMAAGCWFIPVAGLYVPLRVVADLLRVRRRSAGWTAVVLVWWWTWLATALLTLEPLHGGAVTPVGAVEWHLVRGGAQLVSAALLTLVVLRVTVDIRKLWYG
ncbi:DUF4328 domain-containing protein [Actinosynnema pretiosum subsp. pretiosum]|uniref:DUF4328 domain-containing protein n=1 Tax=Actinosynnema pretiosum subsp. pretiosum TaxID=103721 RepID=A0AA45L2L9_9PSEU|nr:hypothetical protein APASM_0121 [Actinosynnema pretiosum subsp. pretiosum]QUF01798.1 DUF4328 domain-containing protein [Actinosynnema pretiosum subsp. pretiosum]